MTLLGLCKLFVYKAMTVPEKKNRWVFGAAGLEALGLGWKSKEARVLHWIAS
jgi:hypothetical protein